MDHTNDTYAPKTYLSPCGTSTPPAHAPTQTNNHTTAPLRPIIPSDRKDAATAVIQSILCIVAANLSLFGNFHLGFTLSFCALFVVGAIYLGKKTLQANAYGIFCAVAAIIASGAFVWHNDATILFFTYCGIIFLTMVALVECCATTKYNSSSIRSFYDVFHMLLVRPFVYMRTAISAMFHVDRNGTVQKRRTGTVLAGVACSIPALIILIPLLINADAAFEGLMKYTILDSMGEIIASIVVGVLLFLLCYSRLFSLRHDLNYTSQAAPIYKVKGLDHLAINSFLGVICVLYAVFLFSQLAYFSSAFAGILPEEYSVAQYARRGFFEMCAVCSVNLLLASCSLALSRKTEGKAPLSTRVFALFILVFSIAMIATALSKMILYISSFGMTRLRILTSVFMLMLASTLLYIIIRLFVKNFPYMRATVITVAILGLMTSYADVDTIVAYYNVNAYQNNAIEEIDVSTISKLSDGAIPYLIELLYDEDDNVADEAAAALAYKFERIQNDNNDFDFRTFNVDTYRAHRLLAEHYDAIDERFTIIRDQEETKNYYDDRSLLSYEERALMKDYFGYHYYDQDIDILGTVEGHKVIHAYYPNDYDYTYTVMQGHKVCSYWLCEPYKFGIYLIIDDKIYTMEECHSDHLVDTNLVYDLLPYEMKQ